MDEIDKMQKALEGHCPEHPNCRALHRDEWWRHHEHCPVATRGQWRESKERSGFYYEWEKDEWRADDIRRGVIEE